MTRIQGRASRIEFVRAGSILPKPPKVAPNQADSVQRVSSKSPRPAKAASKVLLSTLAAGRELPRSSSPEGSKPLLTRRDSLRLGELENSPLGPFIETELAALSTDVQKAIFLRAALAQVETAKTAHPVRLAKLEQALTGFAKKLKSRSDATIRTRASVLDLDSKKNTSSLDPISLSSRRGTIRSAVDTATDNDGLYQRFTASCGPTVVQMMVAEADPMAAESMHQDGLTGQAGTKSSGVVAGFQKSLLEDGGGKAIGRYEITMRSRVRNAAGRLAQTGELTEKDKQALSELFEGKKTRRASKALESIRAAYPDFPSPAEVNKVVHRQFPKSDEGIGTDALIALLAEHVTPRTGVQYVSTNPPEGFARGQVFRHLDKVADQLRRGFDLPFGISEPAHWMLLTHVEGKKPFRKFLVSDPDGGRTAWVKEADFRSGVFADKQFHLCLKNDRPYVDCILFADVD